MYVAPPEFEVVHDQMERATAWRSDAWCDAGLEKALTRVEAFVALAAIAGHDHRSTWTCADYSTPEVASAILSSGRSLTRSIRVTTWSMLFARL
jgi:hypothetical protein